MLEKTLSELGDALGDVACFTPAAFERFAQQIPAELVLQALAETGTASLRRRRLPAEQVVTLLIGMALLRDQSITAVADKLEIARPGKGVIAASRLAEARARLGASPLEWLFITCSERWATRSALASAWRGLSVYGVDGTTLRVADSSENRAHSRTDTGSSAPRRRSSIASSPSERERDVCGCLGRDD